MAKLNDLQLVLLATAAQHDDGNLLPLNDKLDRADPKIGKAVTALVRPAWLPNGPLLQRKPRGAASRMIAW